MKELWTNASFLDKVYIVFAIFVLIATIIFLWEYFTNGAVRKMQFIEKAQKEGCCVPCKVSCFTKEGKFDDPHYVVEYMYKVDEKPYFVTYKMAGRPLRDSAKDEFDADMLAMEIKKYMVLFYDKKKPKKVLCKAEVFASDDAIEKIYTNQRHNAYRDVDKDWMDAIDLTRYY